MDSMSLSETPFVPVSLFQIAPWTLVLLVWTPTNPMWTVNSSTDLSGDMNPDHELENKSEKLYPQLKYMLSIIEKNFVWSRAHLGFGLV